MNKLLSNIVNLCAWDIRFTHDSIQNKLQISAHEDTPCADPDAYKMFVEYSGYSDREICAALSSLLEKIEKHYNLK